MAGKRRTLLLFLCLLKRIRCLVSNQVVHILRLGEVLFVVFYVGERGNLCNA